MKDGFKTHKVTLVAFTINARFCGRFSWGWQIEQKAIKRKL
jgi:hypothetical protein